MEPRDRTGGSAAPEEPRGPTLWMRSAEYGLRGDRPVRATLETSPAPTRASYDMHFGLEFGVLLSGRMRRHYRLWEVELEPGQVWFAGMWERHGWEVSAGSCTRLVSLILPGALHRAHSRDLPELDWMLPFRVPPWERPQAHGRQRQEMLAIARRVAGGLRRLDGSGPAGPEGAEGDRDAPLHFLRQQDVELTGQAQAAKDVPDLAVDEIDILKDWFRRLQQRGREHQSDRHQNQYAE